MSREEDYLEGYITASRRYGASVVLMGLLGVMAGVMMALAAVPDSPKWNAAGAFVVAGIWVAGSGVFVMTPWITRPKK